MKKVFVLFLIILSSFSFINITYAEKVTSFSCEYIMPDYTYEYKEADKTQSNTLYTAGIKITVNGKNIENISETKDLSKRKGDLSFTVDLPSNDDMSYNENKRTVTVYKEENGQFSESYVSIFKDDKNMRAFLEWYSGNDTDDNNFHGCPTLAYHTIDKTNFEIDVYGKITTEHAKDDQLNDVKSLLPSKAMVNGIPEEEFNEKNGIVDQKEPECFYNTNITGLNKSINFKVVRSLNIESNKYSYKVVYDNNPYVVNPNSGEVIINLTKPKDKKLKIKKSAAEKIFEDKACFDTTKLMAYVDKEDNYVITNDEKDVINESKDGKSYKVNEGNGNFEPVELEISIEPMTCSEILGPILTKIAHGIVTILQIVGAIITIVKGMLLVVPAVVAKDAESLKKASRQLMIMGIILALIIIFRPLVRIIGTIFEYDVSCIF